MACVEKVFSGFYASLSVRSVRMTETPLICEIRPLLNIRASPVLTKCRFNYLFLEGFECISEGYEVFPGGHVQFSPRSRLTVLASRIISVGS